MLHLRGPLHLRAPGAAAADQGFDLDLPHSKQSDPRGQHHPAGERTQRSEMFEDDARSTGRVCFSLCKRSAFPSQNDEG